MEVNLTDDQRAFIREALQSGRIQHEEDAVQEAMLLWEERERHRMQILATVDAAEISLARGEGRTVTNPEEPCPTGPRRQEARLRKIFRPAR